MVLVCVSVVVKHTMYQCKVDVDMLNTVKSVLAEVSSISPSSEPSLIDWLIDWLINLFIHKDEDADFLAKVAKLVNGIGTQLILSYNK